MILLVIPHAVFGHPHVFVDFTPIPRIEGEKLQSIGLRWIFDRFTSEMFIEDIDKNNNGEIDESEMPYFDENYRTIESEANFFLMLFLGSEPFDAYQATLERVSIADSVLIYDIDIQLIDPIAESYDKALLVEMEDPDNFVAYSLKHQSVDASSDINHSTIRIVSRPRRPNGFAITFSKKIATESNLNAVLLEGTNSIGAREDGYPDSGSNLKWFRTALFSIQALYNRKLGDAVINAKDNFNAKAAIFLTVIAFLYGMLHALGPGHGKSIVVGYYLQKKSSALEVIGTTARISLLHTGSAVFLAFLLQGFLSSYAGMQRIRFQSYVSFAVALLILFLGIALFFRLLYRQRNALSSKNKLPDNAMGERWIYIAGLVPCPLSITIMLIAASHNIPFIGLLAIMSISLGMLIVLTIAGLTAMSAKSAAYRFSSRRWGFASYLHDGVEILGTLLIVIFGASLTLLYMPYSWLNSMN